jgi:YD repeat-containing protein
MTAQTQRSRLVASIASSALFGACASVTASVAPPADAAPTMSDATSDAAASARPTGCLEWVLTDREEFVGGAPNTDLHRTFDGDGRLVRQTEHIRTGGHGIDRTYREWSFQWSPTGLVVERVDQPGERHVFELVDGRVARASTERPTDTLATSYQYDPAGRVVERTVERVPGTRTVCTLRYDGARLRSYVCTDGEVYDYTWEDDRLVRIESPRRGGGLGLSEFRWGPGGRLLGVRRDDGYGPGRAYEEQFAYDAAGRLVGIDVRSASDPVARPARRFAYDAAGRLVHEASQYDARGEPTLVLDWERDAQGRPSRVTALRSGSEIRYTYADAGDEVQTTETGADAVTTWRFRCFRTPARLTPVEPLLGAGESAPVPSVVHYPVAELPR